MQTPCDGQHDASAAQPANDNALADYFTSALAQRVSLATNLSVARLAKCSGLPLDAEQLARAAAVIESA